VLTFFTTAKPFQGHSWRIQRNALASWTLIHPSAEVILFGDEQGAAETAREPGLRHEPYVERNEYGTKRLDYMFSTARAIARLEILCNVNCDIILMEDFRHALERVKAGHSRFLMVGRRWDTEKPDLCDFSQANWRSQLQALALMRREDLQRKLGMAARETMERFTWERTGRMVEALFKRTLIAEGRRAE
jgi:hypothetical protein